MLHQFVSTAIEHSGLDRRTLLQSYLHGRNGMHAQTRDGLILRRRRRMTMRRRKKKGARSMMRRRASQPERRCGVLHAHACAGCRPGREQSQNKPSSPL